MGLQSAIDDIIGGRTRVENARKHNGWTRYTGYDAAYLGIDPATCTMTELYIALGDYSEIYLDSRSSGWAGNPNFPGGANFYGTVHVTRYAGGRAFYVAAANGGGTYYTGTYNTTSQEFDGWNLVFNDSRDNIVLKTKGASAGLRLLAAANETILAGTAGAEYDINNHTALIARDYETSITEAFRFLRRRGGVSSVYLAYGTHNITISTAAPAATLANHAMHMTY